MILFNELNVSKFNFLTSVLSKNIKKKIFPLQIFSSLELRKNLIKMNYLKEHSSTKTLINFKVKILT